MLIKNSTDYTFQDCRYYACKTIWRSKMKRFLILITVISMFVLVLSGCSAKDGMIRDNDTREPIASVSPDVTQNNDNGNTDRDIGGTANGNTGSGTVSDSGTANGDLTGSMTGKSK